jgi:ubiquinone/menaquinone biosynthesis C-methylase UbiE
VKAYYHARAAEYDDFWLQRGLYERRMPARWHDECARLADAVAALPPVRTLDVACGTGFLTQHLRGELAAVDQSAAMIEIAGARVPHADLRVADALELPFPDGSFDRIFMSYFYCHLEEPERLRFLAEARRVAAELVIVGSKRGDGDEASRWEERVLNDGSRWQVYKRVFEPDLLLAELGGGRLLFESEYFLMVATP